MNAWSVNAWLKMIEKWYLSKNERKMMKNAGFVWLEVLVMRGEHGF